MLASPRSSILALVAVAAAVSLQEPPRAHAASAAELNREATAALNTLYRTNSSAKLLGERARGIHVFPSMVKAGFMFGGQLGEGVLRKGNRTVAYYNSVAASYGFQAGVQSFGYALFFMNDA